MTSATISLYQTQKVRLTLSNLLSLLGVVLAQVFRVTLIFGNGIRYGLISKFQINKNKPTAMIGLF